MKDLSFWAQSLDNQAPDVIFKDGQELFDDELRQKLVSEIYDIPDSNTEVIPAESSVTVRYNYQKFVIEAIPAEKDQANRLAPIVIYGILPDDFSEFWIKDVCNEIEIFVSERLKRTFDKSVSVAINDWLHKILKKKMGISQLNLLNLIRKILEILLDLLRKIVEKLS